LTIDFYKFKLSENFGLKVIPRFWALFRFEKLWRRKGGDNRQHHFW